MSPPFFFAVELFSRVYKAINVHYFLEVAYIRYHYLCYLTLYHLIVLPLSCTTARISNLQLTLQPGNKLYMLRIDKGSQGGALH